MSGFRSRQRTMTRTSVNASSITLNFDSFPLVPDLPAPGMRVFFCFGKALPEDEGKPETENTLPPGGRLSVSPESRSGLTHRRMGVDSQERIHVNTRGRPNGRSSSGQGKNLAARQRFQNKTDVLRFSLSSRQKIRPGGLAPERRRKASGSGEPAPRRVIEASRRGR